MIRNQWYAVLDSKQVRRSRLVGVTRLGEKMVFWRDGSGAISCLRDQCAHRGAALSAGCWWEGRVKCPFHGFEYDSTGQCRLIPANGEKSEVPPRVRVPGYSVREAHGYIYLWWGEEKPNLPAVPFFADIDDTVFSYATIRDSWRAHYSRAIENQLDVMHLPFVHYNTIGRGNRTLVDGPLVSWQNDDLMFIHVFNRIDDGTLPVRPDALTPRSSFRLEFQFPNLWQNHLGDSARIVVAFVPVDDDNTLLYLRFYQRAMRLPVLRSLADWGAMPFNRVVLHQDRRVVQTQRPKRSDLRLGEMLAQGDRPIVEYRRRRRALIEAAGQQT